MAETITGIKILKTKGDTFYGTIDNEELTKEYSTVEEVAETIDNYYYNLYNNSGYTTTYRVNTKKKQPVGEGVVATMSVRLIEL